MVQIKICGITREEEALWLNEADVDYAGFVLYEKSKRNVTIQQAKKIFEKLNQNIKKVAVTVSPDSAKLGEIREAGFDIVQIHGKAEPEIIDSCGLPVWRAVNLKDIQELKQLLSFGWERENIQAVLVDAGDYGSGKTFGWEQQTGSDWQDAFEQLRRRLRESHILFLLAGGLNPCNVAEGIRLFSPDAVDVSSGVEPETEPFRGKSREKLRAFVQAVRQKDGMGNKE